MSFPAIDWDQKAQSFQGKKKGMTNKYDLRLLVELKESEQSRWCHQSAIVVKQKKLIHLKY